MKSSLKKVYSKLSKEKNYYDLKLSLIDDMNDVAQTNGLTTLNNYLEIVGRLQRKGYEVRNMYESLVREVEEYDAEWDQAISSGAQEPDGFWQSEAGYVKKLIEDYQSTAEMLGIDPETNAMYIEMQDIYDTMIELGFQVKEANDQYTDVTNNYFPN